MLPDIVKAARSEENKADFITRRAALFSSFRNKVIRNVDAEYERYIFTSDDYGRDSASGLLWLHTEWRDSTAPTEDNTGIVDQLLRAYQYTRLTGQHQYTHYKLKQEQTRFFQHPHMQVRWLSTLALVCVLALLVMHAAVVIGVFIDSRLLSASWLPAATVCTAIVALAGRTLEEGLHPHREIERLHAYRIELDDAMERINDTRSVKVKLSAMRDVERAAFTEMVSFLNANQKSRFVM